MTVFLIIGSVGLVIVLVALVLGEIFDGIFEALDLDGGGIFSGPVIGSFLASFGFGASLVMYSTGIGAAGGALAGLASGMVVGGIAVAIMRSLINMPTDETVRTTDLVGRPATVVTRIPEGGMGEVTLTFSGQMMKLNARSQQAVAAGTPVVVTAVTSASSVVVQPADPT